MTTSADPDRQLARIRALLAKAEHPSTPPPEAEAMSEKAAELMARYAIDRALVDAASPSSGSVPVGRTVRVLAPYAVPKAMLLSGVAAAYRVRAVIAPDPAREGRCCTLVGYAADLDLVELLFTSLLLQASTAMRLASDGQRRVRAFRHAFLMGYAGAASSKVRDAQQRVVDESASRDGASTALVLRDRREAVDRVVGEMFPRLGRLRTTVSDGGGLRAGRVAGSAADLGAARRSMPGGPARALR
jgi:hypothetical protein